MRSSFGLVGERLPREEEECLESCGFELWGDAGGDDFGADEEEGDFRADGEDGVRGDFNLSELRR